MPKSNICIVGLTKSFTDELCKQLSSTLEMFYANVDDLLEYELLDKLKIEEVCGREYLLKEELSVIRRICSFDNTVINIDYSNLNNDTTLEYVKSSSVIIYVQMSHARFSKELDKEQVSFNVKLINSDLFADRDFVCSQIADIIVPCEELSMKQILDRVIQEILKYYS